MLFKILTSEFKKVGPVLSAFPSAVRRLLPTFLLLTAHCSLLTNAAPAQQVVDKMVATVNAAGQTRCQVCLITYSDLLWQLALQPDTVLANPSSEQLNRALTLIIDQRLILQEAEETTVDRADFGRDNGRTRRVSKSVSIAGGISIATAECRING